MIKQTERPLLIQGAMDVEVASYVAQLSQREDTVIGGYVFHQGLWEGYPLVVSQTKIGTAHCAAATALGIQAFQPVCILNQGLAGAHSPNLTTGDIVLGEQVVPINSFEKPLVKTGIHYTQWKDSFFFCDEIQYQGDITLLSLFQKANYPQGAKVSGKLGAGDVWNREWEFIHWLHETCGSLSEDMESLACYQIAHQNQIPVLGIRIISNNELREEEYNPKTAQQLGDFITAQLPSLVAYAKAQQETG